MFPYRPVSPRPVSLRSAEPPMAPIPLWACLALCASMASLLVYLAFLHFKKSERSREALSGAVKVPLLGTSKQPFPFLLCRASGSIQQTSRGYYGLS